MCIRGDQRTINRSQFSLSLVWALGSNSDRQAGWQADLLTEQFTNPDFIFNVEFLFQFPTPTIDRQACMFFPFYFQACHMTPAQSFPSMWTLKFVPWPSFGNKVSLSMLCLGFPIWGHLGAVLRFDVRQHLPCLRLFCVGQFTSLQLLWFPPLGPWHLRPFQASPCCSF